MTGFDNQAYDKVGSMLSPKCFLQLKGNYIKKKNKMRLYKFALITKNKREKTSNEAFLPDSFLPTNSW